MGPISTHSIYFMDFLYYMNIVLEEKNIFSFTRHSGDLCCLLIENIYKQVMPNLCINY